MRCFFFVRDRFECEDLFAVLPARSPSLSVRPSVLSERLDPSDDLPVASLRRRPLFFFLADKVDTNFKKSL